MRGFDYRWVEALNAVIDFGSFDRAAEKLYISQSAVSQRIKQLERYLAQPVLIREVPPRATSVGTKLVALYRKVTLLEQELIPELMNDQDSRPISVNLASNADSLATWLIPALSDVVKSRSVELNISIAVESRTIEKLKSGEVAGAISLESRAINGCRSDYLGQMEYLCVASPQFVARYFKEGVNERSLMSAPAVCFDQYDAMHRQFLDQHFELDQFALVKHTVASSEAFVRLALSGLAYCLIARLQIESELASGLLVDVTPGKCLTNRIYWHHWQLETGILKTVSESIINYAHHHLPQ
jgi:LysR family transcriptional regulator (chromosome initiation inhibitor)